MLQFYPLMSSSNLQRMYNQCCSSCNQVYQSPIRHRQAWSYSFHSYQKWANPGLFCHLVLSFQKHITNFTANRYVKKCPSSIWYRDSNLQPLEHEYPPITTRPGLPSASILTYVVVYFSCLRLHVSTKYCKTFCVLTSLLRKLRVEGHDKFLSCKIIMINKPLILIGICWQICRNLCTPT